MRLRVIGASGSVPGPGNPASAYLVTGGPEDRPFHLLLDCGPGAYGELQRHLDPAALGAVGLTHLHPDHCLDLCALHVAGRHSPTAPWPMLPVYGPPGTRERIAAAYRADPADDLDTTAAELAQRFAFTDWVIEQRIGPFTVTTARVDHPVETHAVRVDDGTTTLVYSGDTGPCAALVDLAADADLLVVEAGFGVQPDPDPGVHLTADQAGDHAARARVRRLLLTHIPPWYDPLLVSDAAAERFDGEIGLARPGLEIVL